jgi:S-adenosylmethionine hydrolase
MRTITFLSDFGLDDWFVAAVKGEILKLAPGVSISDITHNIKPYDVRGAAFVLCAVFNNFPGGSIHLAVVDPGVGSERKPLVVQSQGHLFVGPDNGLFSNIYEEDSKVYEIKVGSESSATFHARDIFGPAAARLAIGIAPEALGTRLVDYVRFEIARPEQKKNAIFGAIAYVDHFGNCITNIPVSKEITSVRVSGQSVSVTDRYGSGPAKALVCVKGSLGYYEIASYTGNAAEKLRAHIGLAVEGQGVG